MFLINPLHSLRALFLIICVTTWLTPAISWGEEDIAVTDSLFSAWEETPSNATRIPKPLSQTAENVTVITAEEIKLLNAHTLADILDTIPGIQLQHNGGPGITAYTFIQSGNPFFSQIFVDGVSLNNLSNNFADVSSVPAQIIDRIEIIKGSASAAWGSALNGVINVITKSPEKERAISGSATASIGTRTTANTRAEVSGSVNKIGYYISGGYLGSDGLFPTMEIHSQQLYTKLTYDLPHQGKLWGTFSYNRVSMGHLYIPDWDDARERADKTNLLASLGLQYTLAEGVELEIAGKYSSLPEDYYFFFDETLDEERHFKEKVIGGSVKLLWRKANNLLAIGSEYNHQESKRLDVYSKKADRWGIYLNDTFTLGPVSISPGVRLDHTETDGDQVSSSLGMTWQVTDKNLLRAYTGRGYSVPFFLNETEDAARKIWTMQIGAESTAIPYLWIKGTLFRNLTWGSDVEQNLAMGSELELRTTPLFNTSLGASWTYTETTRTSDGTPVRPARPTQTVKLALRYDDATFRGVLTGSHINWNAPDYYYGRNGGLIWDLHLAATLLQRENSSLELFFSGRNLFNGKQYQDEWVPNPGRWFEGGVRVRF